MRAGSLPLPQHWLRLFTAMLEHHLIIVFCFLSNILCYVDRTNISVAIIPMSETFKWSTVTQGYILAAFYVGYVSTQILGMPEAVHLINGA